MFVLHPDGAILLLKTIETENGTNWICTLLKLTTCLIIICKLKSVYLLVLNQAAPSTLSCQQTCSRRQWKIKKWALTIELS
jgi:hypothetical protein